MEIYNNEKLEKEMLDFNDLEHLTLKLLYEGNEKSRRVQQKLGFVYQYTTHDLDVSLMGEKRTGHTSILTKEHWEELK